MAIFLSAAVARAGDRAIMMSTNPQPGVVGTPVRLICTATGDWRDRITSGRLTLWNASGSRLLDAVTMRLSELTATYDYTLPSTAQTGTWKFQCAIGDGEHSVTQLASFLVATSGTSGGIGRDRWHDVPRGPPEHHHLCRSLDLHRVPRQRRPGHARQPSHEVVGADA